MKRKGRADLNWEKMLNFLPRFLWHLPLEEFVNWVVPCNSHCQNLKCIIHSDETDVHEESTLTRYRKCKEIDMN